MSFKIITSAMAVLLCSLSAIAVQTTHQASGRASSPQLDTGEVIRRFAAAESENRVARNNYTFTQDFEVLTLGEAGSVTGKFHRVSDIVYDDRGQRVEKITFFPPSTLYELQISDEDMQDLAGVQPFALATEDLAKYNIVSLGKEKVDELNTYVFDVKPKTFVKGERYFQGKVWVDDQDLQIVKAAGQAVPEVKDQKFPHFESYRENIDEKYWFPTYVYADDVLDFKKGPSVHMRMTVRYKNYKKFTGRIKVVDEGEAVPDPDAKPAEKKPAKPPQKPPER